MGSAFGHCDANSKMVRVMDHRGMIRGLLKVRWSLLSRRLMEETNAC